MLDTMSGIRDLIVVTASVLAFSAVADADELRPIRALDIDLPEAAAPAVEIDHGLRVRVPSLGDKTTADIPIWRTVTLGTYKTIDALRNALDAERIHVGDRADEILGRPAFNLSKMRRDARLVVLAVSELGFDEEGASLADIHARARQLGFELCPAEVGPQLRLQYLNQPLGEFLHIAMRPIAGYVQVFGRRQRRALRTFGRPASEKRQGTKSREVGGTVGAAGSMGI